MSGDEYDPYWCVIRPDHRATNNNATTNNNAMNDDAYDPYWNVRRPSSSQPAAVSRAPQPPPQPSLQTRTFGAHVASANTQHAAAHSHQRQQHHHGGGAADMDIVMNNPGSHAVFAPADPFRAAGSIHRKTLPSSSFHTMNTLDKTITSAGDMTMSSDEFERLRMEGEFWPETYDDVVVDDHHQQKPRALEPVKSHNMAAASAAAGCGNNEKPRAIIQPAKGMQVSPLRSPDTYVVPSLTVTNIQDLMNSIARPPLEGGDVMEVGELEDIPTPGIIQPWMAVIGDKSARLPPRLTAGSMTLREVKTWYQDNRENYQNMADLYHDAMEYYFGLMKQRFGRHFPSDRLAQEATILVYCGSPEKPVRMERVEKPHCYKHRADMRKANANKYGIAKLPIATQQFLTAKDGPPPLDQQLLDYCTRVEKRDDLPERERKTFILYLSFTKALLDQANAGCPLAKSGLKKTNLNTSLRDLWKELSGN